MRLWLGWDKFGQMRAGPAARWVLALSGWALRIGGQRQEQKQIPSGNDRQKDDDRRATLRDEGRGIRRSRFPSGMTDRRTTTEGRRQKDEGRGIGRSRFPSGMTDRKATTEGRRQRDEGRGERRSERRSRFPPGMTDRKAAAAAKTGLAFAMSHPFPDAKAGGAERPARACRFALPLKMSAARNQGRPECVRMIS
jgi:hypothetical protein